MASTRTDYITGKQTAELLGNEMVIIENQIDLSVNNSVASDVIQALKIAAGQFVHRVGVLLLTVEGGALTCTVGDGDDPNGWNTAVDLNDLTGGDHSGPMYMSLLEPATDLYGIGKYYAAADTIDLTMSAAAGDAAKFTVWALVSNIERKS
jgi:hypothetical protein